MDIADRAANGPWRFLCKLFFFNALIFFPRVKVLSGGDFQFDGLTAFAGDLWFVADLEDDRRGRQAFGGVSDLHHARTAWIAIERLMLPSVAKTFVMPIV